jgi:flagellar assembly protein FliH
MALIKNRDAAGLVTRGFEDLGELKSQADQIIAAARAEAGRVLDEARAEAQTLIDEATPRGFAEGREQGLTEGLAEGGQLGREDTIRQYTEQLESLAASWSAALDELVSGRQEMLHCAREDIVQLALAIAGKITRRVIELDPDVVKDQVADVLGLVNQPSGVTLSINPEDRKLVESVLPALCERLGRSDHVELRDDPSIERGGCVLATGKGRIDATVNTQIDRIAAALLP